ncbi:MAG: HIT family protein [Bryobacteraceae bacterium]
MSAECPFCRVVSSPNTADIVWEDEHTMAFLDRRPLFPGHCLLIPKPHYETLADLPPDQIAPLFAAARILCVAVTGAMRAEGTFLANNNRVSQSVPHLHVHIVPRRKKDGLRGFFWPRSTYRDAEDARAVAAAIREEALGSKPLTSAP